MTPRHGQRQVRADQAEDLARVRRVETHVPKDRGVVDPSRKRGHGLGCAGCCGRDLGVTGIAGDDANSIALTIQLLEQVDDNDMGLASQQIDNRSADTSGASCDDVGATARLHRNLLGRGGMAGPANLTPTEGWVPTVIPPQQPAQLDATAPVCLASRMKALRVLPFRVVRCPCSCSPSTRGWRYDRSGAGQLPAVAG